MMFNLRGTLNEIRIRDPNDLFNNLLLIQTIVFFKHQKTLTTTTITVSYRTVLNLQMSSFVSSTDQ